MYLSLKVPPNIGRSSTQENSHLLRLNSIYSLSRSLTDIFGQDLFNGFPDDIQMFVA